ncbi:MAG: methyltransferase family protein [Bacteroidota bacterium]
MISLIIFFALSVPIVLISRRNLFRPFTHGFWRFLSWECIAGLFAANYPWWFRDPFSTLHLVSWSLLVLACVPLIAGVLKLRQAKKDRKGRSGEELFEFEKTSELIDTGIFRYIRHPLYCSLILLAWGIALKQLTPLACALSAASSVFLYICARLDERECIQVFGERYLSYKKRSKMFIPFLI